MATTADVGRRAARVLTDEFIRRPGPKTGVIVGATAGHAATEAAVDALLPDDRLTLVVAPEDAVAAAAHLAEHGTWVSDRVTVATAVSDVAPADVVMLAEPVADDANEFVKTVSMLRDLTAEGGILTLCATLTSPAAEDIADLVDEYGVDSDVVLRNRPPLRIHRLSFDQAPLSAARDIAPTHRAASVPITSRMHIDSNGLTAGGILLGVAGLTKLVRPKSKAWMLPALAAAPAAAFFRDPQRHVDDDPYSVVASGDGKVLSVEHVVDERFGAAAGKSGAEWLRIAIFLSVLDVHVNRSPFAGRVADVFRENGGYAPAMNAAAEHNVACYTVVDTEHGRVAVAQRTGLVARRIVNRTQPGALLAKGERYGLIRFGSRTDVYLPAGTAEARVAPGERVVGGETAIARWLA